MEVRDLILSVALLHEENLVIFEIMILLDRNAAQFIAVIVVLVKDHATCTYNCHIYVRKR